MSVVNARKIKLAAHLVSGETPPEKRRKFGRGERKKLDRISWYKTGSRIPRSGLGNSSLLGSNICLYIYIYICEMLFLVCCLPILGELHINTYMNNSLTLNKTQLLNSIFRILLTFACHNYCAFVILRLVYGVSKTVFFDLNLISRLNMKIKFFN